ncbi:type I-E CRISPR-associated protein Cas5/CasD [Psychromicrobium sp. YIM B11713]|uniref:type I-E CRISPR-associated protein Cas5/CasD n=1 Tax=Psychromicrobium sp. YIM B11713 TaxID=3145233 RepID=UPI00374E5110
MSSLTFVLKGAMQSWGGSSRFLTRGTEQAPTKSGVIGLLAAAKGKRRTEPLTEFLNLKFGVRIDQPGRLIRDFQTAKPSAGEAMPLSYRYYLGDAVFLAGIESEDEEFLESLAQSLAHPVFPLYLGRRSCPPILPLKTEIHSAGVLDSLKEHPWQAAQWHKKKVQQEKVKLEILLDAEPLTPGAETFRDEPLSFDPRRREYGWRSVKSEQVEVGNDCFVEPPGPSKFPESGHDPLAAF